MIDCPEKIDEFKDIDEISKTEKINNDNIVQSEVVNSKKRQNI
jgi:hypothetical protein